MYLCRYIYIYIYIILIFTLEYVENVHSLVWLPARLLVFTVQCNFASNIRETAHCTQMVSDKDLNFTVVLATVLLINQ